MAGLIAGGLKLLGGWLAARSARKAEARQRAWAVEDQSEQFVRLRDAAEKAGFNPLTALRANPGGGMVNPTPALASGQFVADALTGSVDTYFNAKAQERDAERDMLEKALMREELRAMQAQGRAVTRAGMAFGFEVPQANNYTGTGSANSAPALADPNGPRAANGRSGDPPALVAFGRKWEGSGAFDKGQVIEDNLGDSFVAWPIQLGLATDMVGYTIGKELGVVKAPYGAKPGKSIPEGEFRKPFPRSGASDAFNFHMGRHRPYPAYAWPK